MQISVRWLKEYLHVDMSVDELTHTMMMAGLEVEGVIDLGMGSGRIVVAQVLEVQRHPDADKLKVCKVDTGRGEPVQVVCGAPNVTPGKRYPCALPGAELPNGVKLKKTKIRGQASEGMLCAADELGLGTDHTGILPLPETYPIGEAFDYIIDIKVTPNRADCLSILGVARDIGAMVGRKVFPPTPRFKEMLDHIDRYVRLSIQARAECPRYACRVIRDVRVGESPLWLRRRLEACGLRPINNVVDVTNYVLMELGHPLHAFDCDLIEGSEIRVRMARPGEVLELIDETELKLDERDLVIADARRAIALAGVMGGSYTEVTDQTKHVLLEAAYFHPGTIRKTAKRHGLQTDASYRFERGTDRARLLNALNRATQLIQELAGGEVAKGCLDVQTTLVEPTPVSLEIEKVNRLLGLKLSSSEIADHLVNLGFEIRHSDRTMMAVAVPSHRVDIERDVDLIEEVARLHGYEKIPATLPRTTASKASTSSTDRIAAATRRELIGAGFCEAINYSFISDAQAEQLGFDPTRQPRVANPLTVDQAIMRPSLLPGLLTAVAHNQKQDEPAIALFELGKVWQPGAQAGDAEGERLELAMALSGPAPFNWATPARDVDFFDLKAVVEELAGRWGDKALRVTPLTDTALLHPGRAATLEWRGEALGRMGEVHPEIADRYDLRGRVYVAELSLEPAIGAAQDGARRFQPIPRLPASWRDLAIVVDRDVAAGSLLDTARKAARPLLEEISVFDLYEGEKIPSGKKSLALRMRLRSAEKTLTDEEIAGAVEGVLAELDRMHGAELRS